nr:retrotransposon protein, putative, Ty1-copia subclass [Tanacetum cinerariifolium]
MENSKKGTLTLHHDIKISKDLCPKTDEELDRMSRVPYALAIGSIMYSMMCTRPDVSFASSMVSRHLQKPGEGSGDMKIVGNKMHKAFPLLEESSHWQYNFPLPVEGVPTARRMEIPLPRVCTAMMKKLPERVPTSSISSHCQWRMFPLLEE